MKVSDAGVFAIALHEGLVPAPYKDSVGVWTFGIGHTAAAGAPDPAKMARGMPADLDAAIKLAIDTFRIDLAKYEAGVERAVKVPLKQHEFDALVSFHYNTGAIAKAQLTKALNAGDRAKAAAGFMGWVKPPEIRKRREAERDLFATGMYPGGTVNVWGASHAGAVVWKPVARIGFPEFVNMVRGGGDYPKPLTPVNADKPKQTIAPPATSNQTGGLLSSAPQTRPAQAPEAVPAPVAPDEVGSVWARLVRALLGILRGRT